MHFFPSSLLVSKRAMPKPVASGQLHRPCSLHLPAFCWIVSLESLRTSEMVQCTGVLLWEQQDGVRRRREMEGMSRRRLGEPLGCSCLGSRGRGKGLGPQWVSDCAGVQGIPQGQWGLSGPAARQRSPPHGAKRSHHVPAVLCPWLKAASEKQCPRTHARSLVESVWRWGCLFLPPIFSFYCHFFHFQFLPFGLIYN